MSDKVAVTYKGTTTDELGDYFQIDGEDGTTYVLHVDASTAVPREVANQLAETKGHRFEIGHEAELTVDELKEELEGRGVEFPASAKKAELQELLGAAEQELA